MVRERVLVVNRDATTLDFLCHLLERDGYEVLRASGYADAIKKVEENLPQIVLSEVGLLCGGEAQEGNRLNERRLIVSGMVGRSPAFQEVLHIISKVADTDSTVLIYGESGTGKELVARTLHFNSHRRGGPYIPVNCGAIPESLLESELFGHEKGAFTGANTTRPGRFELANGGTVLLDEVGNMSPAMQVKVLRILQERKFERLGGIKSIETDVRVVAATNHDLEGAMEKGEFREDLFYRLNVIPIVLPPLRERTGDLPLLASHFLGKFNALRKKNVEGFSLEALSVMERYRWPGNVRELENVIDRLVVLKEEGVIYPEDLPDRVRNWHMGHHRFQVPEIPEGGLCLDEMMENIERELILKALEKSNWVKQRAAKLLNLNRTTLVEKMKKSGLRREQLQAVQDMPTQRSASVRSVNPLGKYCP